MRPWSPVRRPRRASRRVLSAADDFRDGAAGVPSDGASINPTAAAQYDARDAASANDGDPSDYAVVTSADSCANDSTGASGNRSVDRRMPSLPGGQRLEHRCLEPPGRSAQRGMVGKQRRIRPAHSPGLR